LSKWGAPIEKENPPCAGFLFLGSSIFWGMFFEEDENCQFMTVWLIQSFCQRSGILLLGLRKAWGGFFDW